MGESEILNDIDKRVVAIEVDLRGMAAVRKIIWSLAGAVVIGATSAVYGYGQLTQKIEHINITEFESHIGTLLTVAADHGTELVHIRGEIAEIRGVHTTFNDQMFQLRTQIDDRTAKRFYKSDGDRLSAVDSEMKARILRLENRVFK